MEPSELSVVDFLKFDRTKLDAVAFRKWLIDGIMLLEPAIITPGNVDKFIIDQLEGLLERVFKVAESDNDFIVVGASTGNDVDEYITNFGDLPEESVKILKNNPSLVKRLKRLKQDDQVLVAKNPFLLLALQTLLPLLFKLLLNKG